MLVEGETIKSVADQLGMSIQTVKRYKSAIEQSGLVALERMSVGGRKSVLDSDALAWIAGTLRESPVAHGFDTDQWSDGRLTTVIEQQFGVRFSRVYVRQLVINLGFSDRLRPTKGTGPSSSVLNSEALSWIAAVLRHSPRVEGFDADRWSNGRLRIAIERRFGVSYSRTHVWKIATDLGLSHLITKARK
jgi:transposase